MKQPAIRQTLRAFLGLCAFAVVFLHRQMLALYSVPDLGDPLLSIWRMGWLSHWLYGDPRPLFSPNIFYPEPLTLTYSDSTLLPSLMGFPLLAAGLHPVVVYNLLFISGFVLSGWAMYLLVARLTASPRAAFVSALLFAFYPFRFDHYSHFELQMTMWMPLGLLALHRFLERGRARWAAAAALCVVAQLYSSMYFAVFFCLYLVPVVGVLWLAQRLPLTRLWRGALAGALIVALLALPLIRPYAQAQSRKGDRGVAEVTAFSATLEDYVSPNPRSLTYSGVLPRAEGERGLFPGVVAPALAAAAIAPPVGVVQLAYAAGLLLAFEASRGFHGVVYPRLYDWLMPIRGLRVPARFSLIVGMSLAILAGFGCVRLIERRRTPRAKTTIFLALLGAIVFDLRSSLDLLPVWRQPPSIYAALDARTDVVLAEFPWWSDRSDVGEQVPLMYFSLWHWRNMVNGASGFEPPHYQDFLVAIHRFPDRASIDALRARGVTHVTVNCALYGADRDCHSVLVELDGSSEFRTIARSRWEGDVVALYELVR